jgi:hypothetical protein
LLKNYDLLKEPQMELKLKTRKRRDEPQRTQRLQS